MIIYVRGRIRDRPVADGRVEVTTSNGVLVARVVGDPGPLDASEPVVVARAEIEVGVAIHGVTVLLGPLSDEADDPGPLGLASTPVVVVDPSRADIARAGARRSGRALVIETVRADAPSLGLRLLEAVRGGADVLIVEDGAGPELWLARALGGRAVASLPLADPSAVGALVAGLDLDVQVSVPSCDEPVRSRIRSALTPFNLEAIHHLVEVDPVPAFDELERDVSHANLDELAAAAAGVLAGRLVAANRRWRAELEA